ncbi:MAG: ABC transporter permease [Chloroflexota bacterium]|nr:ABC transporter permease [Chloroflexota bacterium]
MSAISHTLSVAWKEIQLITKDRGSLAVLFLLPLLFGSLYGSINLQVNSDDAPSILLDVCLVNQDEGIFGEEIATALEDIKELNVRTFDVVTDAEQQVAKGEATAAIVIPADFTHKIAAYTPTAIDVIVDPAQPESASIVTGIMNQVVTEVTIWGEVQYGIRTLLDESGLLADASAQERRAIEAQSLGAIMTQLNEIRRTPAIVVASEDLEGAKIAGGITIYFALMFPGITVMFVFFIVGMVAASLLTERETGTLRRLLAAPIPRGAIIAGKMLAYMLLVCLQVVVLFSVASIFFAMPLGQSPVALVLLTLALALAATAMGMLVAALSKTPQQADNIGTVLGFVLAGIGGCIAVTPTPLTRSEGFLGVLSKLTPHAHAVEGYYRLMAENATFVQVLPEIGILSALGITFFVIATWRFKFE